MTISPAACPLLSNYRYHPNFNGFAGYRYNANLTSSSSQIRSNPLTNTFASLQTNRITTLNTYSEYRCTIKLNYETAISSGGAYGIGFYDGNIESASNFYSIGFININRNFYPEERPWGYVGVVRRLNGSHTLQSGIYDQYIPQHLVLEAIIKCIPKGSNTYDIIVSGVFKLQSDSSIYYTVSPYTFSNITTSTPSYGIEMLCHNIELTSDRIVSGDTLDAACLGNIYADFSVSGNRVKIQ